MRNNDPVSTSVPVDRLIGQAMAGAVFGALIGYLYLPRVFAFFGIHLAQAEAHFLSPLAHLFASLGAPLAAGDLIAPVTGGLIGLLAGPIAGWIKEKRALLRRQAMQAEAAREGAQFSASAEPQLSASLLQDFPNLDVAAQNVLRKEVGGVPLALLEISITTTRTDSKGDERSSTTTQTAAYYHSPQLFFPRFTLRPADLTMKLISAVTGLESLHLPDASEFAREYFVLADDPARARLLLDASVRAWLMARPGLHIDSGGSGVLVYRAGEVLDPDAFEWFMADLAQLFQLLSDPQRHAQMQTAKDDLRAAAAQLPGVAAERLLATLTPDDEVDAFVRQSPPRSIPASIGAWRDEGAPIRFLALLAVFAVGAALMTGAFILQGEWLGTLFGAWFVVVLTVLVVVVAGERLRLTRLLRHGEFAVAKVERVEPTKVKTGRGRIFDVTVRYQARGQAREGKCRLDGLAADRAQRLATYGKPAAILYDPVNPERVLLIDVLANG